MKHNIIQHKSNLWVRYFGPDMLGLILETKQDSWFDRIERACQALFGSKKVSTMVLSDQEIADLVDFLAEVQNCSDYTIK